uniref:Uncharacterized protein n=1 Tax=Hordeum vulgare subsp. vulgare TaxID=112509 RepID=A0A8I6WB92_HORVV
MTCAKATNEEKALILSTLKLDDFMRNSCYYLEPDAPKKKNDDKEIERYSDRKRKTQSKREALASYLKLIPANFPAELLHGSKRAQPVQKKLRWDKDANNHVFDVFEKLEANEKASHHYLLVFFSSCCSKSGRHISILDIILLV